MDFDPNAGRRTAAHAAQAANPALSVNNQALSVPVMQNLHWFEPQAVLSRYLCWDAMLLCAHLVRGIRSPDVESAYQTQRNPFGIITYNNYSRVFPRHETHRVIDINALLVRPPDGLPLGAFLGFVRNSDRALIHAMIFTGLGRGAGTANGCIFSHATAGWELIDLRRFFTSDAARNNGISMIFTPVEGQYI